MRTSGRLPLLVVGAMFAFAVPAFSAEPSAPPGKEKAPGQQKERAPQVEVTLNGTVERTTDERGRPVFTLTQGGTTWELSAGPKWWWGEDGGPLGAFVGKNVEIKGSHREGSTDVGVDSVDGQALRAENAGRPPWAGGPKVVGEKHPAWKAWQGARADGRRGDGLGRGAAPGQLKEKPAKGADDTEE